jgi:aspartyl-tRNA(Asn)/glutamyl-tRNA(Gln) amidotransferase subunit C
MNLTKDQVEHVAKLADLQLSDEEIIKLEGQLSETLEFVKQLDEVETEGVEPTHSVTGLSDVMRPDEISPSLSQDQALQNVSEKSDGYFKVKAVFENRE